MGCQPYREIGSAPLRALPERGNPSWENLLSFGRAVTNSHNRVDLKRFGRQKGAGNRSDQTFLAPIMLLVVLGLVGLIFTC
jgi:hypothetical protein